MTVRPLHNNLYLKLIDNSSDKVGDILLIEKESKQELFKVIDIGELVTEIHKGQVIILDDRAVLNVVDRDHAIANSDDVIAIVGE